MAPVDPDLPLRQAAVARARRLAQEYDELVPLPRLRVLGIDPDGVVHIARRLLDENDGPMLRTGLQGFHGQAITLPRRAEDRPDRRRLEVRFERFERAAAWRFYFRLPSVKAGVK